MERINRVNQMMRREIAMIVRKEMGDPRLDLISISRVEVSRDLQHAKVFFCILGDETSLDKAQTALNSARGFIRRCVAQRVSLKFIPELTFFYDKSSEYQAQIEEQINELSNE
jgi:ribosome-binding factor A